MDMMNKKQCIICGKEFFVDSWSLKHRASKYCSRKCMGTGRKTGQFNKCIECGKSFYIIPAHLKRRKGNGQFCSKECMWKSPVRNLKLTGKNHYNWTGGNKNLERQRFRDTIKNKVFERDNYTCQMCGIRGVVLQVDHIQPWAEYIEGRFDMDNCRTLCIKCHYQITFGKPMPSTAKDWGHNRKYNYL